MQKLTETKFLEDNVIEILVSIYKLKRTRMKQLLDLYSLVPQKESLLLESVRGSCLSLIKLKHTQKVIPSCHPKFQQFSTDFESLFKSMEKCHKKLRDSLKGVTVYMYLYTAGLKRDENYNQVVNFTVDNQLIFEDSSSMSSSSQQSS
mmetsp:Transcript_52506/g.58671  ORF Transcript_52506/g.58671 Transcript_52506/m.58671 type:complete len:148 (+) Transcript_52506:506-949(+)